MVAIETAVAREGLSWQWLLLFDKKSKKEKKRGVAATNVAQTNYSTFNVTVKHVLTLQFPANKYRDGVKDFAGYVNTT